MTSVDAWMLQHPSVRRIKRVAVALRTTASDIVFIGGAIAPLLQTDPPFAEARPTKDVDGIVASTTYSDLRALQQSLSALGFRQSPDMSTHLHRWTSPDGDLFDVVPAGQHLGGSGHHWDQVALISSVAADLGDSVVIRHASAPAFLGLKWAAHADRGSANPFSSHDLEDILALLASRPTIVSEIQQADADLREFLVAHTMRFLNDLDRDDLLAGHLNNAQSPAQASKEVLDRVHQIAAIA